MEKVAVPVEPSEAPTESAAWVAFWEAFRWLILAVVVMTVALGLGFLAFNWQENDHKLRLACIESGGIFTSDRCQWSKDPA